MTHADASCLRAEFLRWNKAVVYCPIRTNILLGHSRVGVQRCLPPPDLAETVSEFWQYDVAQSEACAPIQIYPSGLAILRFDIGIDRVDAAFYGPSLSPRMRGLFYRNVPVFGVAICATRTFSLFGVAADELRDLRVQLELMWPNKIDQLKAKLWEAHEFAARVLVLSDFLRGVLRPERPDSAFMQAFHRLVQRGGCVAVRDARGELASERTLRRQFARFVGLSPKQMARVFRFQSLMKALTAGARSGVSFARLAQHVGYADQAHMIREFSQLVGVAPGRFVADLPRLHDLKLEIWKDLRGLDAQRTEPPIRRLI